jgi:hypothetical protein
LLYLRRQGDDHREKATVTTGKKAIKNKDERARKTRTTNEEEMIFLQK